jgi:hypothetical protein
MLKICQSKQDKNQQTFSSQDVTSNIPKWSSSKPQPVKNITDNAHTVITKTLFKALWEYPTSQFGDC